MDIHPPHSPIRSVRDFAIQLITITAGVLIALSFEGLREAYHEHAVVREARDMLSREITDNRREVDNAISKLAEERQNIDNALKFAEARLAGKNAEISQLTLNLVFADLSTASWVSAERTGALSYMSYAVVRGYSKVFGQQEIFAEQQRQLLQHLAGAFAILGAAGGDPTKASLKDVEAFHSELLALNAGLYLIEQLGSALSETYRDSLQK